MKEIKEGKAKILVSEEKKISKELVVFYNPVMKLNRDLTVLILNCIDKQYMQMALPMAGSGIRGIRLMKELDEHKILGLYMNDYSKDAVKSIKDNLKLNNLRYLMLRWLKLLHISNKDADSFFNDSKGFDYIDLDPFGPPISFLDSAIKRLSRDAILAVTATDTSALCGSYPNVCKRKYWATPKRGDQMYEIGLRILIRRVQMIGISQNKALKPVFSYSKDHYMRVFFSCIKSKKECNEIIKNFGTINGAGPMWIGKLWDNELVSKMLKSSKDEAKNLLEVISKESDISQVLYYNIHSICKTNNLAIPKYAQLFEEIQKKGYKVSRTHFDLKGIKSDITEEKLISTIRRLNRL